MTPDIKLNNPGYIHPTALAYGDVTIEEGASLWPYTVIRAESGATVVGPYTNIQDFVMIHTSPGLPTLIGSHCSITHHCTIHGAKIGDNVLVGINSTLYDGCVIGSNSIIGQHSYVKDGTVIPENSIVVGSPARVVRTHNAWVQNRLNAMFYHRNALAFAKGDYRAWAGPDFEAWLKTSIERLQQEFMKLADATGHAPA
jgi:carbonic anhydrase/acetyltransferase-like protein (isoleucine patch superfamily)